MCSKDCSTEEKIKLAAKEIFFTKGFEGTSIRDIAKLSNVNIALINYYFRSKKNLYEIVFYDAMQDFFSTILAVFHKEISLKEKLTLFIEMEYDFVMKHPELPNFILTGVKGIRKEKHDEKLLKVQETGVINELLEAQAKGQIRQIDFQSLMLLIVSNCHYPFIGKEFLKEANQMDEAAYKELILNHKKHVSNMLVNYLFLKD